jgi:hypothetical protein
MALVQYALVINDVTGTSKQMPVLAVPIPTDPENGYPLRAGAAGAYDWSARCIAKPAPAVGSVSPFNMYEDALTGVKIDGTKATDIFAYQDVLQEKGGENFYRNIAIGNSDTGDGAVQRLGLGNGSFRIIGLVGQDAELGQDSKGRFGSVVIEESGVKIKAQNGDKVTADSDGTLTVQSSGAVTLFNFARETVGTVEISLGSTALDKVGFFGTSAKVRQVNATFSVAMTTTALLTVNAIAPCTAGGAFNTKAEGDSFIKFMVDNVVQIRAALINYGLISAV